MRFLNGVERSSYSVRISQKFKKKKRVGTDRHPSKNLSKIMRFLNGVERSSYSVRISQKFKKKKRVV